MTAPLPLGPHVRSFFEDYLACRKNVSRNTIRSYRDALKLLLRFAAERGRKPVTKLLVTDISAETVVAFLTDLQETRTNSIQTRNHRLVAVRNLFDYIAARHPQLLDHCQRIAAIPRKRGAVRPTIRYLEKEQMTALFGAASGDSPRGRRDHALLLFMYNTGARVQEVADARVGWLTLHPPFKVELLGKGRKWRLCPLWENTVGQLRQLLGRRGRPCGPEDYLFVNRHGEPLSRAGIADIIRRCTARAAAATPSLQGRRVTPHTLRHTTAMHLLQAGVEVNVIRSWLGHVSIATTNHYIEIDLEMKAKALAKCEVAATGTVEASWQSSPDILAWLESL